ncbi:MAG TPA: hypothetical protein DCP64_07295, partial [Sarcina sp.]|nr:hypothetical protein [Sarcina sp.]
IEKTEPARRSGTCAAAQAEHTQSDQSVDRSRKRHRLSRRYARKTWYREAFRQPVSGVLLEQGTMPAG